MYSTPRPFNNITNIVDVIQRAAYSCPPGTDPANTEAMLQQIALLYYATQQQQQQQNPYGQTYAEQDYQHYTADPYSSYPQQTSPYSPSSQYTVPSPYTAPSPYTTSYHTAPETATTGTCSCIYCQAVNTPSHLNATNTHTAPAHDVQQAYSTPQRPTLSSKQFATPHDDYAVISCTPSSTRSPLQSTVGVTPIDESTPQVNRQRQQVSPAAANHRREEKPERDRRVRNAKFQNASEPAAYTIMIEGQFGKTFQAGSPIAYAAGDHVLFDGDRGTDLGKIVSCKSNDTGATAMAQVLRVAEPNEVHEWTTAFPRDQNEAVAACNSMIRKLNLPLKVVNAIFQFDRKKLTFLYEADQRVDFRTLLHEMYQQYRCRIWMDRASE